MNLIYYLKPSQEGTVFFSEKTGLERLNEVITLVSASMSFKLPSVSKIFAFPTRPHCLINTAGLALELLDRVAKPAC